MKGLSCKMARRLQIGTVLKIIDNSGATRASIIGVKRYGGVKNRYPKAGIADIVICTVLAGAPEMKHKLIPVVVVQQRGTFKRADGTTVRFNDNAGVMIKSVDDTEPKGTIIKEPVAKEAIDRFTKIGKVAKVVI